MPPFCFVPDLRCSDPWRSSAPLRMLRVGTWRGRSDATPGPSVWACGHIYHWGLCLGPAFKEPGVVGGGRHMWMDCAPPNQLQEIQGLLRSTACLSCKHVHVYRSMCFHINSGTVADSCSVVGPVGTRWIMNCRFSNLNNICLFHLYSLADGWGPPVK